ncbi:MAG: EAL domain-containing protein [Gammaproteobacteria bacterium]|nr:EAL domain-containing protein [Gammaproteobacteria bacterium]
MDKPNWTSGHRSTAARHGHDVDGGYRASALHALGAIVLVATCSGPAAAADPDAAPSERGRVLIVGGDADFPPHQFIDDGEPSGFDIEVALAAAKATGLEVRFELGPWASTMDRLVAGEIDLMAGMSRSPRRREQFDFTVPYTQLTFVAFVAEQSSIERLHQLEGGRVLIQEGGVAREALRRRFDGLRLIPAATVADALRRLLAGEADAAVVPKLQGLYWMKRQDVSGLRALDEPVTSRPYGFAVRARDYRLLQRLEEGIAVIREGGQFEALRERWFAPLEPRPWWQRARSYLLAAAALAVLLATAGVWNALLRRRVAERTGALAHSEVRLARALDMSQALVNSLPAHIALTDSDGTILEVNEQWRRFGLENANPDPKFGVGANYLEVCERATGDSTEGARAVADGVRAVLSGERESFSFEYPCHSADARRWFQVMATHLVEHDHNLPSSGAVIMHVDITERILAEQALERLAHQDPLTGLLSRSGFVQHVEALIADTSWQPDAMFVSLNVRGLHDVNEAHGFEAGDQLLVQLGERLRRCSGSDGAVGRTGGNDFIVFLPERGDQGREQRLQQLLAVFDAPFELVRVRVEMDARFGYTQLGERRRSIDELLREASLALSHTRFHDSVQSLAEYNQRLKEQAQDRIRVNRELRDALEQHDFELQFQPKVVLATGEIISCEALLRWRHPERGLQPPDSFIPHAEQSQLIGPIGDWVVNEACRCLRQWQGEQPLRFRVAVNVSLVQLLVGDFVTTVREALALHDLAPSCLSLEITESVFERQLDPLLQQLTTLHDMGVQLSLDDFGTGYSSLLYLQRYPFDEIKIDKGFVQKVLDDPYSRNIVNTVVGVAGAIGAEAVAEGVEDQAVSDALQELGCQLGQGFYYSVPLEAEDFRWLLQQRTVLPLRQATS